MHIGVSKLAIIGSDCGLSPVRRQTITWTNAGKLLIGILGTNFCEILSEIHTFSVKKIQQFCHGLNVLKHLGKSSRIIKIWRYTCCLL